MILGGVDFPDSLLEAHANGEVVIFAGAGVSMGAPSNLPSFYRLAVSIAGASMQPSKDEPLDRFLGRVKSLGVKVHERACELLTPPSSMPTVLHRSLITGFATKNNLRLVTTNFDNHFSTVATEVFGDHETYIAPALPLGDDFNGIVYLHGSVRKSNTIVLTDADFGRAYITSGWATKFLVSLFQRYTVIFVGYSHNDPVMHYLARGLPPANARRFILTDKPEQSEWTLLGITPIGYSADNNHAALTEGIKRFADHGNMTWLDHENRVERLVSTGPPSAPEDADYLKRCLHDPRKLRFFVRRAKGLEWLKWIMDTDAHIELFSPERSEGECATMLAWWFADNFVWQHSDECFALLGKRHNRLHHVLWNAIRVALMRVEGDWNSHVFASWIGVLLSSPVAIEEHRNISSLLRKCRIPQDKDALLVLFEFLSRPIMNVTQGIRFSTGESIIQYEVDTATDMNDARDTWEKHFRPAIDELGAWLEAIVIAQLRQVHLQLRSVGRADEQYDPVSAGCYTLVRERSDLFSGVQFLIDIARELFEWRMRTNADYARALIGQWYDSGVPILRRMAIYGMQIDNQRTADDKLAWLLARKILYNQSLKNDVFQLLKVAYPNASGEAKQSLLDIVSSGPTGSDKVPTENAIRILAHALWVERKCPLNDDWVDWFAAETKSAEGIDADEIAYDQYNVLTWLNQVDPACTLARKKFDEAQAQHPNFRRREHPDLTVWSSTELHFDESPLSAEELLSKEPRESLEKLLSFQGSEFNGPSRRGLISQVSQVCSKDFQWGCRLIDALKSARAWDSDIWSYIFLAWQQSLHDDAGISTITEWVRLNPESTRHFSAIIDMLQWQIRQHRAQLKPDTLIRIFELLVLLVESIKAHEEAKGDVVTKDDDWYSTAINDTAGKAVESLCFVADALRKTNHLDQKILNSLEDSLEKLSKLQTNSGMCAATICGRMLSFLFGLDSDWARKSIIPLLDWTTPTAAATWHGYVHSTVYLKCLPDLLPHYRASYGKLSDELKKVNEAFVCHIVVVAFHYWTDPHDADNLPVFIREADDSQRRMFASKVQEYLQKLTPDQIHHHWETWLKRYWKSRIDGDPVQLQGKEIGAMAGWPLSLEPVVNEAVDLAIKMPPGDLNADFPCHNISRYFVIDRQPAPIAKLQLYILQSQSALGWFRFQPIEDTVKKLALAQSVPSETYTAICNELARLGCSNAAALRGLRP